MGSGHVMRCLTLAHALQAKGGNVTFLSRLLPGHLVEGIRRAGFDVRALPAPLLATADWLGVPLEQEIRDSGQALSECGRIDWLVVDHYGLDCVWQKAMRVHAKRLLVIDDLANRVHDCDLLLDQNLSLAPSNRYEALVPAGCRTLLGPKHVLLREEFTKARRTARERTGEVRRVFVFFGGGDATNETAKALEALRGLDRPLRIDVVLGATNPHKATIEKLVARMPATTLHVAVDHMAALMTEADLAIGAGGTTTWERSYLGLPTIVLTVADNQREGAHAVAEAGGIWYVGDAQDVSTDALRNLLKRLVASPDEVRRVSQAALALMAGHGETPSLVDWMMGGS